jgi:hypothetical protein
MAAGRTRLAIAAAARICPASVSSASTATAAALAAAPAGKVSPGGDRDCNRPGGETESRVGGDEPLCLERVEVVAALPGRSVRSTGPFACDGGRASPPEVALLDAGRTRCEGLEEEEEEEVGGGLLPLIVVVAAGALADVLATTVFCGGLLDLACGGGGGGGELFDPMGATLAAPRAPAGLLGACGAGRAAGAAADMSTAAAGAAAGAATARCFVDAVARETSGGGGLAAISSRFRVTRSASSKSRSISSSRSLMLPLSVEPPTPPSAEVLVGRARGGSGAADGAGSATGRALGRAVGSLEDADERALLPFHRSSLRWVVC